MTWTKEDAEALRVFGRVLGAGAVGMGGPREADIGLADVIRRAADEIERLRNHVAALSGRTQSECLECASLTRLNAQRAEAATLVRAIMHGLGAASSESAVRLLRDLGYVADRLERKGE